MLVDTVDPEGIALQERDRPGLELELRGRYPEAVRHPEQFVREGIGIGVRH